MHHPESMVPRKNYAALPLTVAARQLTPFAGHTARQLSCGLDRDQFVLYVVESHEAGMRRAIFKMKGCCLKNIGAKFLPGLCLGEDGMS